MDNLDVNAAPETNEAKASDAVRLKITEPNGRKIDIVVPGAGNSNEQPKVSDALGDLIKSANGTHHEGEPDDDRTGPFGSSTKGPEDEPKPGGDDGYALTAANDGVNKTGVNVTIKKAADYGGEPKQPGGYEAAAIPANNDAANSNIAAAEAELKGRVNEAKERHVG